MASKKFCDRCGQDVGNSTSCLKVEWEGSSSAWFTTPSPIYREYDLCMDCALWAESVICESTGGDTAKATKAQRKTTGNIFLPALAGVIFVVLVSAGIYFITNP